jgi:GNAT superfamily N-acetyltransferase
MDRVAEILRSTATWYAPFVEPEDMDQHDVGPDWPAKNYAMREFYVAVKQGEVIGCLSIQDTGPSLYLGYVYLHVDHVGHGYGKQILRYAERELRVRNKRSLVLIAHPEADWAVRAYERFGFERIARTDEDVLAWCDGWLEPYYEKGFHLFEYAP